MTQYKFASERFNLSDYSSGRVFYGLPGYPALPVRLTSELFQRCLAIRRRQGCYDPCVLFDPCCGAAYHLSTLAYLHWGSIREILASDIQAQAVTMSQLNLSLLTLRGLDRRIDELKMLLHQYGKDSHQSALESARRLRQRLLKHLDSHPIATTAFQADATETEILRPTLTRKSIDIVFTDIPYGKHSQWLTTHPFSSNGGPVSSMLGGLKTLLSRTSLMVVVADKEQRIAHPALQRLDQLRVGKRRAVILQRVDFAV